MWPYEGTMTTKGVQSIGWLFYTVDKTVHTITFMEGEQISQIYSTIFLQGFEDFDKNGFLNKEIYRLYEQPFQFLLTFEGMDCWV